MLSHTQIGRFWLIASACIALAVLAPVVTLAVHALQGTAAHWEHLLEHVLPHAMRNTLLLLLGVGVVVSLLGVGSAWLMTAYRFPTRNVLGWALLLPLAVPTYIVAFAYQDILHPIVPVQGLIRDVLGYTSPRQFRLPDVRSLGGAIFLLGLVLYPYVYLSTRAMFATQSASLLEAGRILGASRRSVFFRVALPMARPAIAVGLSLALLETLNDIGASEFLGVQTLPVAIYTTWVSRSDLAGAAQIALSMLVLVVALITLERYGRRRQGYSQNQRSRNVQPLELKGGRAIFAMCLGWLPVLLGFIAPSLYLLHASYKYLHLTGGVSPQLLASAWSTLYIALITTGITLLLALVVAWASRGARQTKGWQRLFKLSSIGYAIPGTVLALGLLLPFVWFDNLLENFLALFSERAPQLLLMGSSSALVIAYCIRFLAIGIGSLESGLARIPPSVEQASRLLGESPGGTLRRVHLPLLRPAMGAAALLIFVDTMKELPATLLLRPMNFETLATWLYAEAARGTYEEGAIAALAIVVAGLLPIILLAKAQFSRQR